MTGDKKTAVGQRVTIPVTRHSSLVTWFLLAGALWLAGCKKPGNGAADLAVPPDAANRTQNFSSVEYYAPPHQTQMKSRLSGAEAQPEGGLLFIKQLKLEMFNTNGILQAVIEAPDCIYDTAHNTANSAGHLQLRTGDGKIRVEGDGFLWRRDDSFLTISNHQHTAMEIGPEMNIGL